MRQAKTVGGGTPINYLWDRESGLPLLVDDGSTAYLHADGLLENISGSTDVHYLGDALGSVRGLTDGTGSLTATADYDVFGALRGGAGTGTFGFTGEQYALPDAVEPQRMPQRQGMANGARFLCRRADGNLAERRKDLCQNVNSFRVHAIVIGDENFRHLNLRS